MKRRPMGLFAGLAAVGVAGGAAWYFGAGRAADQVPYRAEPRREVRFIETPSAPASEATGWGAHGAPDEAGAEAGARTEPTLAVTNPQGGVLPNDGAPIYPPPQSPVQALWQRIDAVRYRYEAGLREEAQGHTKSIKVAEALAEWRACYELALVTDRAGNYPGNIVKTLGAYSRTDPRPLAVLDELRNVWLARMSGSDVYKDYWPYLFEINYHSGQQARSVQFYDAVPVGDSRKRPMGEYVFYALAGLGRYEEAVQLRGLRQAVQEIGGYNGPFAERWKWPLPKPVLRPEFAGVLDMYAALGREEELAVYIDGLLTSDRSGQAEGVLRDYLANRPDAALVLEKVVDGKRAPQ